MGDTVVQTCSQHGRIENGKCHCYNGWTSIGDFNPIDGLDCGIDMLAVRSLAYVSIILGSITMIQYLTFLLHRKFISKSVFAKKDQFALAYFIQTLTANIYIIILIINPDEAVFGYSIFVTLLIYIAYLTAFGGTIVFFEAVMILLLAITKVMSTIAQKKMKESVALFTNRTRYLYLLCFFCSLNGLTGLCFPPEKCKITGIVWFYSWSIFTIPFMFTFNPPVSLLRSELKLAICGLEESTISQSAVVSSMVALKGIYFNMTIVQITLNFIFILTTVLFILWASVDILMRRAVYLTLYCSIGVHIFSVPMLMALTYKPKGLDSTASRAAVHPGMLAVAGQRNDVEDPAADTALVNAALGNAQEQVGSILTSNSSAAVADRSSNVLQLECEYILENDQVVSLADVESQNYANVSSLAEVGGIGCSVPTGKKAAHEHYSDMLNMGSIRFKPGVKMAGRLDEKAHELSDGTFSPVNEQSEPAGVVSPSNEQIEFPRIIFSAEAQSDSPPGAFLPSQQHNAPPHPQSLPPVVSQPIDERNVTAGDLSPTQEQNRLLGAQRASGSSPNERSISLSIRLDSSPETSPPDAAQDHEESIRRLGSSTSSDGLLDASITLD